MLHKRQLIEFSDPPAITSWAAIGSEKEGQGPLGTHFDEICPDSRFGQDSWEKGEAKLQERTIRKALQKASISPEQTNLLISGDLINQCIASAYCARNLGIPYAGIYNACASMAEGLIFSSILVGTGLMDRVVCAASSHFCTAERQYRYPLEYGGQRPPSAQWTATACGCALLERQGKIQVKRAFFGKAVDYGITDLTNMGAAMAPAAYHTLTEFFAQSQTVPEDYDAIVTGDLGKIGSELLNELLEGSNVTLYNRHLDCGKLLYGADQDVHAGGSGCGCCASVLCSYLLKQMDEGKWKSILFLATGALMSPLSVQQGESIPCISHLLHLKVRE